MKPAGVYAREADIPPEVVCDATCRGLSRVDTAIDNTMSTLKSLKKYVDMIKYRVDDVQSWHGTSRKWLNERLELPILSEAAENVVSARILDPNPSTGSHQGSVLRGSGSHRTTASDCGTLLSGDSITQRIDIDIYQ